MAQYLVTEYSKNTPRILVLGDALSMSAHLARILEAHGFAAVSHTFADLDSVSTLDNVFQESYYKIICLFNLAGASVSVKKLLSLLGSRREPLLLVARFDSTPDIDDASTHQWYESCHEQYLQLVSIAKEFPRANLLIVRDLLLADCPYHPAFPFIFSQIDAGLLTNPGFPFLFVSESSFLLQIESSLFLPYTGEKTLFSAEAISPVRLFSHLEDITDHRFQTVESNYPPVDFAFPFSTVEFTGQSDLRALTPAYLAPYLQPAGRTSAFEQKIYDAVDGRVLPKVAKPKKLTASGGQLEAFTLPPPKIKTPPVKNQQSIFTLPPEKNSTSDHKKFTQNASSASKTVATAKITAAQARTQKGENKPSQAKKRPFAVSSSSFTNSRLSALFAGRVSRHDASLALPAKPSKRQILKAVRTTITSTETTVLEHYLELESATHAKPECQPISPRSQKIACKVPAPEKTAAAKATVIVPTMSAGTRAHHTQVFTRPTLPTTIYPAVTATPTLIPSLPELRKQPLKKASPARSPVRPASARIRHLPRRLPRLRVRWPQFKLPADFSLARFPHSWAEVSLRLRAHRILISFAASLAVICVLFFFLLVQPKMNQKAVAASLSAYFPTCQDLDSCFAPSALRRTSTLTLVKSNHLPDFLASLTKLIDRYHRLEDHASTYLATLTAQQSGDVYSEVQILEQMLTPTSDDLKTVRRLLTDESADLLTVAKSTQLETFATQLDLLEQRLKLIKEYLPFLEVLASQQKLTIAAVFLDDQTPRTGGGLIMGTSKITLTHGSLEIAPVATAGAIIAHSPISVHTPHQLEKVKTTETDGLRNLTFHREFPEVAILLGQDLNSSLGYTPDLTVSINLTTLSRLETLLLGTPATETIAARIGALTTAQRELALAETWDIVSAALVGVQSEKAPALFYHFLQDLDDHAFQFFTTNDSLNSAITKAGLADGTTSVLCPNFDTSICFLDTFAQHDDYLAANSGLTQEVTHEIELTQKQTHHQRTIDFVNTNQKETAIDYLTFDLPVGATLESLSRDGRTVELDEDNAYTLTLGPGESTSLRLKFSLEHIITSSNFTYSFYDQHQNGFPDQKLKVIVQRQIPYAPRIIGPSAITSGSSINFVSPGSRSFFGAIVF